MNDTEEDNYQELPIGKVHKDDVSAWNILLHYMEPVLGFYQTPGVTEIMINRYDTIFIEENGRKRKTDARFQDNKQLETFIKQVCVLLGQVYDDEHAILDARFPDCSRLCCTRSNVSTGAASVTIRVAPKTTLSSNDLLKYGALTQDMLDYIDRIVQGGANIIVSGSTGSGKTTLLRMLTEFIDPELRVITCEDTQELFLNLPNTIALEAPKRRVASADAITLSKLIKTSLRQAPDRIWVGEIRDAPAADAFLQGINTGHSGCATTVHSNGCYDTVERIQYLLASSGLLSYELTRRVLLGSVHVLIHASKTRSHGRKITEIMEVIDGEIVPMFEFDEKSGKHIKHAAALKQSCF